MAAPSEIDVLFRQFEVAPKPTAASLFGDGAPVYLYGAGNVGKDLCRALKKHNVTVAAFLDRNAKAGAVWEGVPILLPDDSSIAQTDRKKAHIVIGIFNRDVEIPPVMKLLKSLGYGRVTGFPDVHHAFAAELGDRFWLTSRDFYPAQKEQIAAADALFKDEKSRSLFRALLRFRLTGDYRALLAPSLTDQYLPGDLPPWPAPIRLVDCGAYDGDTLRALAERKLAVEAVAAFEPDPANFALASQTARKLFASATICLAPCGVDASTRQVRFAGGQGSSSSISASGETVIQCVSLDDALPSFRPNLIKMDIEGAEYDALLGARAIIEHDRPGLAISVYHRAEHLWTIPLLMQSWLKGGRHYLRAHAFTGFELIYYWMP